MTKAIAVDLGTMNYQEAFDFQADIQQRQIRGEVGPVILTVEHPPTITIGKRGTAEEVVAPVPVLKNRGVDVVETDRGGQVTYHGPGQLVVYPLINVEKLGLHEYLRLMEDSVMKTMEEFGLEGYRVEGRTGVWVGKEKVCAMGIRVRKWWSIHGMALNVTTDLNHFGLIIPCGIRDRGVTSLEKLLGSECPPMPIVRRRILGHLGSLLGYEMREGSREELLAPVD